MVGLITPKCAAAMKNETVAPRVTCKTNLVKYGFCSSLRSEILNQNVSSSSRWPQFLISNIASRTNWLYVSRALVDRLMTRNCVFHSIFPRSFRNHIPRWNQTDFAYLAYVVMLFTKRTVFHNHDGRCFSICLFQVTLPSWSHVRPCPWKTPTDEFTSLRVLLILLQYPNCLLTLVVIYDGPIMAISNAALATFAWKQWLHSWKCRISKRSIKHAHGSVAAVEISASHLVIQVAEMIVPSAT